MELTRASFSAAYLYKTHYLDPLAKQKLTRAAFSAAYLYKTHFLDPLAKLRS